MSIIVMPMAGNSSRFFKQGYKMAKYKLKVGSKSLFELAVATFEKYFREDLFLFIVREDFQDQGWVEDEVKKMSIRNYRIIKTKTVTKGQAETVLIGLKEVINSVYKDNDVYIFNIDSFNLDFEKPVYKKPVDGYLELVKLDGDHWSFAKLDLNKNVTEVAEKVRISEECSTGLYYFKDIETYKTAYNNTYDNISEREKYVAPMYNDMINKGMIVKGVMIKDSSKLFFSGTPEEYENLLNDNL